MATEGIGEEGEAKGLPPGQSLDAEMARAALRSVPHFDAAKWELQDFGAGEQAGAAAWENFGRLPQTEVLRIFIA